MTVPVMESDWCRYVVFDEGARVGRKEGEGGSSGHRPGSTQVKSALRSVLRRRYAASIYPNQMLAAAVCNLCAGKHEQLPRRQLPRLDAAEGDWLQNSLPFALACCPWW